MTKRDRTWKPDGVVKQCVWCRKMFEGQGQSFCSRSCSGKYGNDQRWGGFRERFEKMYEPDPVTGCWMWLGTNWKGYGQTCRNGKKEKAYRASYELYVGAIPPGLTIDHLCRTPLCVNPSHLEPVTRTENALRQGEHTRKTVTHCSRGHEYTEENTHLHGPNRSFRACKECRRANQRASYHARKSAGA